MDDPRETFSLIPRPGLASIDEILLKSHAGVAAEEDVGTMGQAASKVMAWRAAKASPSPVNPPLHPSLNQD